MSLPNLADKRGLADAGWPDDDDVLPFKVEAA
jgi:hypothetical protein